MLSSRTSLIAAFPALIALTAGSVVCAQTIVGTGVPTDGHSFTPVAISADGRVVVGNDGIGRAFLWSQAGGFQPLGVPANWTLVQAYAASADCATVVGNLYRQSPSTFHAFRWTQAGGFQDLGVLPGGSFTDGYAVSADGSVVVGQGSNGTSDYRSFRWSGGTFVQLPRIVGSISGSEARGASADGSIVVGDDVVGGTGAGYRGYRWTVAGIQTLPPLPGQSSCKALCISADGSKIAGFSTPSISTTTPMTPVVWSSSGAVTNLGLPPSMTESQPSSMSADGSVIGMLSWNGGPVAGVWTAQTGTVNLNTYLPTIGVDMSHWVFTRTYAVSADGRAIAGEGSLRDDQGVWHPQTWILAVNCWTAPAIAHQPVSTGVCPGGGFAASFVAAGAGAVEYGYRWQWQPEGENGAWLDLMEGENIYGGLPLLTAANRATSQLSVSLLPANGETPRRFRCVLSNQCGSTASNPATLTVVHRCGVADIGAQGGVPSPCGDGVLDNNDFIVYIDAFFRGDISADFGTTGGVPGSDGVLNNNDFVVFIDLFFAGC